MPRNIGQRGPYRPWLRNHPPSCLRDARLSEGLTQAELAHRLGVARTLIAMVESGRRELPGGGTETGRKLQDFMRGNRPLPL